jgi:hypothetical protein
VRIAVTGHVDVDDDVSSWVSKALTVRLEQLLGQQVEGITCLARGADQLFARVVLAMSGTIEVVLPARDYIQSMRDSSDGEGFCSLLEQASDVQVMPFEQSSRAAYLAASVTMLSTCDLLLAVWDGHPSRQVGDTADVVKKALARAVPVEVIWPVGAARTGYRGQATRPAAAPDPG